MSGTYDTKIIVSGDIVEVFQYENEVLYGYSDTRKKSKGRQSVATAESKKENRKKVATRAENDLRRIINSNYRKGHSRFITLTFKENVTDLKVANYEFNKFIKRYQTFLGFKLQYSVVVEFQKRGAVHYHCMFYNMFKKVDLPQIRRCWGHGSVNVRRIEHVDNVGAYMVKYMAKNADDERLMGKKCYFNSRNLKKPVELKKEHEIDKGLKLIENCSLRYRNKYTNEYNTVVYEQYNRMSDCVKS